MTSKTQTGQQTLRISLRDRGRPPTTAPEKGCAIAGKWFSLRLASKENASLWIAEVPSAEEWQRAGGSVDMNAEWNGFLDRSYALDKEHCFWIPGRVHYADDKDRGELVHACQRRPIFSLLLWTRRLCGSEAGRTLADRAESLQTRRVKPTYGGRLSGHNHPHYAIKAAQDCGVTLKLLHVETRSVAPLGKRENDPDATLATQFAGVPHLRLLLQGRLSKIGPHTSPLAAECRAPRFQSLALERLERRGK
jgi:hypothetical protein